MRITIDNIFIIKKSTLAFGFLCIGILWAYWSSLMPWFMWSLIRVNNIIPCFFVILSLYVSFYFCSDNIFSRTDYGVPAIIVTFTLLFMRLVNGNNVFGFFDAIFIAITIFALLKLNRDYLRRLVNVICLSMGIFLSISVFTYILYLVGFSLPSSPISNDELLYSFQNYYFFLVDDRFFMAFIPRFHSVFLEPGHLGTATAFLLLVQIGRWHKWYNIVFIITTIITFSLAAYILFIMVMFASAWIQHKQVFLKVLSIIILLTGVGIGSFFYEQGDNMLYTLIIQRMEMEDGKMSGDNRVTGEFEAVFNDYIQSEDILFGREYNLDEFGFGNSGYRVFIYDYGIICLLLVILFYLTAVLNCKDQRTVISVLLIGTAAFWVRATPFTLYYLIPIYALPNIQNGDVFTSVTKNGKELQT